MTSSATVSASQQCARRTLQLGQESVDDLELLDREREEVDLLDALDLAVLDEPTELGHGHPARVGTDASEPPTDHSFSSSLRGPRRPRPRPRGPPRAPPRPKPPRPASAIWACRQRLRAKSAELATSQSKSAATVRASVRAASGHEQQRAAQRVSRTARADAAKSPPKSSANSTARGFAGGARCLLTMCDAEGAARARCRPATDSLT